MIFPAEERQLVTFFCSGSRQETISTLWKALQHISDDALIPAWSAIGKLEALNDAEFAIAFKGASEHAR